MTKREALSAWPSGIPHDSPPSYERLSEMSSNCHAGRKKPGHPASLGVTLQSAPQSPLGAPQ